MTSPACGEPLRYLLVLNEPEEGACDDVRRAFAAFADRSQVADFRVYPHVARRKAGLDDAALMREIVQACEDFRPAVVLWFHTDRLTPDPTALRRIRETAGSPVFAYVEQDGYHWFRKPFPRPALRLAGRCDVAFLPGSWSLVKHLRRQGCRSVRFAPSATDPVRFPFASRHPSERAFDAVFVGTCVPRRVPFTEWPGIRLRRQVVQRLERELGPRFAVYGPGWTGPSARGRVPFDRQADVLADARVAVGVGSLGTLRYAYSDRLPIMLGTGALVAQSTFPGWDEVFRGWRNPLWFESAEEAWGCVQRFLEMPERDAAGLRLEAHDRVVATLTIERVLGYVASVMNEEWRARTQGRRPAQLPNPWLGAVEL